MAKPRSRSGNSSDRHTHTGMLSASCMKNTKVTHRIRMTMARAVPADITVAAMTIRPCTLVVAMNPQRIMSRRRSRSMRTNRQIADPTTASTPLAMFAMIAALVENPRPAVLPSRST